MQRCFREFEKSEIDVVDVSPATELGDYVDSRFHGDDKKRCGNDRERGNDIGKTDIGNAEKNLVSWIF